METVAPRRSRRSVGPPHRRQRGDLVPAAGTASIRRRAASALGPTSPGRRHDAARVANSKAVPSHLTAPARCLFGRSGSHMQITEGGKLGPPFDRRLRASLDMVVPPTPHLTGAPYRLTMQ